MKRDKVIRKIQKLLALAGNNPNEHERLAAMQAAYDMLAAHNLQMKDVVGAAATEVAGGNGRVLSYSIRETWRRDLWISIAELTYCRILFHHESRSKAYVPVLIGTKDNTEALELLANWLWKAIKKEGEKLYTDSHKRRSFAYGSCDAISRNVERVISLEKQKAWRENFLERSFGASNNSKPSTALVKVREDLQVHNDAVIAKLKEDVEVRQVKAPEAKELDRDAAWAGMRYGFSLPIARVTPKDRRIETKENA